MKQYLAEQGKLDAQLDQLGTNLFKGYRKADLQYDAFSAKAREQLGLPPIKPPATLIPQKNKLTQMAKMGLMIGGAVMTGGASLGATAGTSAFGTMSTGMATAWGAGLSTAGSLIPDY